MASQNVSTPEFLDYYTCHFSKAGLFIVPLCVVAWSVLLLPLLFLVPCTGFQRWRQSKRSAVSHTDFFTYNTIVFSLLNYVGLVVYSIASVQSSGYPIISSMMISTFSYQGLLFLHTLTCVERYLAVVHPVVYLRLKEKKCTLARNVLVFVIWLFCVLWTVALHVTQTTYAYIPQLVISSSVTPLMLFCSVQVLRALRNPSPGEGRGASQSKQKAFYTVISILFALVLLQGFGIAGIMVEKANLIEPDEECMFQRSICWLEIPSNLVLPLLFLHRAGKLPQCRGKKVNNRGQA